MADGRIVPDNWSSAPIPNLEQDRATRHLYYDSVYVCEPTVITTNLPRWDMGYYRFWPDGQVLFRPRYGPNPDHRVPTAEEADDFRDFSLDPNGNVAHFVASVGRYTVIGDELTMVSLGFGENGWVWCTQKAKISEDGSFALGRVVIRRYKVEGMKRFADW
jgi:hypothetical protein